MKTKSLDLKIQIAFGAAILTLLSVGAVSYRGTVVSTQSDLWVRHTHEVLENLKDLLLAEKSIELSNRGFLLTGRQSYVESYRASIVKATRYGANIRNLTSDNPVQQENLSILEKLETDKTRLGDTIIDLRQTDGIAAEAIRIESNQRREDEFEGVVRKMQAEELRLLVLRDADVRRRLYQTKTFLVFGPAFGLLIIFSAGWSALRDHSNRQKADAKFLLLTERLSLATSIAKVGIWSWDLSSDTLTWDDTMFEIYGLPPMVRIPYKHWAATVHSQDLFKVEVALRKSISHNRHVFSEFRVVRPDGSVRVVSAVGGMVADEHTKAMRMIGVNMDVTESKQAEEALWNSEEKMTYAAQHDFLTGLPNRMLLNDRIGQAIASAQRNRKKAWVCILDLDGFKHINNSLGHTIGDHLLKSVGKRLVACLRGSDTVSRQGGDEFVVLLSDVEGPLGSVLAVGRMLEAVAEAHSIDHHDLHITSSVGISVYPDDGLDAETLIKNADTAMYQAKESGPQSHQFFKSAMNVRAVARQSIEEALRRALERKEFTLQYQPKLDLVTGKITGAEALLRWTHPTRGPVSPAEFIPVAEDCGLILGIGQWVLRESCEQARVWVDAGLPPATMAVNLSAVQFRNENFLRDVFTTLKDTGLDPGTLELELTESVLMKHAESAESILKALRAKGIKIAVDDFGTGYSSLSYLRRFRVDALKIDQSFIRQITTIPDETAIVTAIISMGRSLKLRVVAEGVETQEQLAFLKAHQCAEAQGYYFSPPVPPHQFAELLKHGLVRAVAN